MPQNYYFAVNKTTNLRKFAEIKDNIHRKFAEKIPYQPQIYYPFLANLALDFVISFIMVTFVIQQTKA